MQKSPRIINTIKRAYLDGSLDVPAMSREYKEDLALLLTELNRKQSGKVLFSLYPDKGP